MKGIEKLLIVTGLFIWGYIGVTHIEAIAILLAFLYALVLIVIVAFTYKDREK